MTRLAAWMCAFSLVVAGCGGSDDGGGYDVSVVADGLLNPVGLAIHPSGGLLIAEEGTGMDDDSAGVSLLSSGRLHRVVSGLPSGRDSGDLSGVPLVGVSPDGSTVYTAHFGSEGLLTLPTPSLKAVDAGVVLGPGDLRLTMEPLNRVRLANPFDITFSPEGTPVVSDASENGVAVETGDGRTEFIHRFGQLRDPGNESLQIDPVPTGISRHGDEYLVTLTGGCPYPDRSGRLVAIDGDGNERVVADGLAMPIDVEVGADGTIWVLEFADFEDDASCFTGEGYLPETGRLSRLDGDRLVPVVDELSFPGAIAVAPDGSLYVSEVFAGRILRLDPAGDTDEPDAEPASPWRLVDVATEVGIDFVHGAFAAGVSEDPAAMMGGGVCWLDVEGDGDMDLYLVNSYAWSDVEHWEAQGGLPTNRLYRNDGGRFTDVTEESGAGLVMRGSGCVAADIDKNGATDLYVTADGPNALLLNDGSGAFRNRAVRNGVVADGWSTTAVAGDVNGDGLVDLFVGGYIDLEKTIAKPSGAFPQDYPGISNRLFVNNGDGRFRDETQEAGLAAEDRTLGALLTDLDDDGDLDLYVANDGQPNALYENRSVAGVTEFVNITREAGVGDSGSGMGVAGGDFDGDGGSDLMVTNWEAELHAVYTSTPDALGFVYSTHRIGYTGLGNGTTGWGTGWIDFDNDTDLDLVVVNGRVPVTDLTSDPEPVQLFGNLTAEGDAGQLRDWAERTGLGALGSLLARGAAAADFDDDGDLDLAINQIGGSAVLLRNEGAPGGSITVAPSPATPGTSIVVELDDGVVLRRELYAGSSYLSSEDPRFVVGIGEGAVVSAVVTWPSGSSVVVEGVAAGAQIGIVEPAD